MNLFKSMRRALAPTLIVASGAICGNAMATEYNLAVAGNTSVNVTGDVGGTAIFRDYFTQPAGTGVFDPFLTLERNAAGKPPTSNSNIEQGYNTDGVLYMDQQRPNWNKVLHVGDLAPITVSGKTYYGFELDANEPGADKSIISIDNIRVYTSAANNTASVQDNLSALGSLGTLRWALNDGVKNADGSWNVTDWVKLDAAQENIAGSNANGGSGQSDMIVLIPTTAFGNALPSDFVWFYNLNGVHYTADGDLAAQAGYEEWRAVVKPNSVPDGGATVALLGLGIIGLGAMRRKLD